MKKLFTFLTALWLTVAATAQTKGVFTTNTPGTPTTHNRLTDDIKVPSGKTETVESGGTLSVYSGAGGIRSSGAAFDLKFYNAEVLTANRALTWVTGNADRTITLSGNPTLANWFDQDVRAAASPTFAAVSATTFTGALVGNASTATLAASATILATGRTLGITGDLVWTSPSFNGSGNVTAAGTLATVNANVGSFGSATKSLSATVNAKGLVTAMAEQTVTPAVGSITGLGANVATWLATPTSSNLLAAVATTSTGTGSLVFSASPTFTGTVNAAAVTLTGTQNMSTGNGIQWPSWLTYQTSTAFHIRDLVNSVSTVVVSPGTGTNGGVLVNGSLMAGNDLSVNVASGNSRLMLQRAGVNKWLLWNAGGASDVLNIDDANNTRVSIAQGGVVSMTSGVASTLTTNGTLVVTGGAGFSGAINAGGTITATDGGANFSQFSTTQLKAFRTSADANLRLTRSGVRDWDLFGGTNLTIAPDGGSAVFTLSNIGGLTITDTFTLASAKNIVWVNGNTRIGVDNTTGIATYAVDGGSSNYHSFSAAGSERLRIASGTTTVTGALTASSNITVNGTGTSSAAGTFELGSGVTTSVHRLVNTTSGVGAGNGYTMELSGATAYLWNYENGPITFGTNNAQAGNVSASGVWSFGSAASSAARVNSVYDSTTTDGFAAVNTRAGGKTWLFGGGTGALASFGFRNSTDSFTAVTFGGTTTDSASFNYTTSGTSTTAAAILGKSMGLTENLYVGGTLNVPTIDSTTSINVTTASGTSLFLKPRSGTVSLDMSGYASTDANIALRTATYNASNALYLEESSGKMFLRWGGSGLHFHNTTPVAVDGTTEATTGGAGSFTTAGGIYSTKKIISGSTYTSADPTNGSGAWMFGTARTAVAATVSTTTVLEIKVDGVRYDIPVTTTLF